MKTKGIIFDLQRCSFHDGPGIRTTVFLKGCPLHCLWCHNPESQLLKPQIYFNERKCFHCAACVEACKYNNHSMKDTAHHFSQKDCINCGACIKACSYGALEWKGKEMFVEDVVKEVLKDKDYYENSGGGLTISGGEPMAQFEFTKALLTKAKEDEIHTCIETCGHALTERFQEIISFVDLFLFDYKATDPEAHRQFTGVSNELILKNLEFLCEKNASVILRCPLIPGVNDSKEHLKGITALSNQYSNIQAVEIMAYHNMGVIKNEQIGRFPELKELPNTPEDKKQEWLRELEAFGCRNVRIG